MSLTSKINQAPINLARAVTPRFLWDMARKLPGRSLPTSYQGVVTPHNMRWLYEGRFAEIFDRHSRRNLFNAPNETIAPYNTDCEFVCNQYPADAPINFRLELIPDCFPLSGLDVLAFVHLNATHVVGEAASLKYLYEKLSPGGFIPIDYHSFGQGQFAGYDPAIQKIGASLFNMVIGQAVLRKPLN